MTETEKMIFKHLISAKKRIYALDDFQDALTRVVLGLLKGDGKEKQSLLDDIARNESECDQLQAEIRELEQFLKP